MTTFRISKRYRKSEEEWLGKHVRYFLMTYNRDESMDGPFTGIVTGLSSNEAAIYDRLEGHDHRNSIEFTGTLIIKPDDNSSLDEWACEEHCEIIEE